MNEINKKKIAAAAAFTKIGKANGTAAPESTDNRFGVAFELFLADHLNGIAKARLDAAKAAALDTGIIKEDYEIGSHVAYNADGLIISARRNKDSLTLDRTVLKNLLCKRFKLTSNAAEDLLEEASKPRKGATTHFYAVEG